MAEWLLGQTWSGGDVCPMGTGTAAMSRTASVRVVANIVNGIRCSGVLGLVPRVRDLIPPSFEYMAWSFIFANELVCSVYTL